MEEETQTNQTDQTEKIDQTSEVKEKLVKEFPKRYMKGKLLLIVAAFLVVLTGVGTGWLLSGGTKAQKATSGTKKVTSEETKDLMEAGFADEETFPDTAEGDLVEGGFDGEGTHHLERGLGPEKDVYLTSTVIDLQSFVGKKVQVWGETIAAKNVGWLMDVGRIKVIE